VPVLQVFKNGKPVFSSEDSGLKPLAQLYFTQPELLKGARVYDKVVGEAAARILILAGVSEVHAGMASKGALALLEKAGMPTLADEVVEFILNIPKTDKCPMETLSLANPEDSVYLNELRKRFGK